ncbi:MAG: S-adenosylmethionine:tRNA ribosyltransferase-isomerase [Caldilineaceae bacterium]
MLTSLFDYDLPASYIAQQPAEPRDSSRLLVYERASGQVTHRHFRDIGDYLRPGDLLVANNSRVIPARLYGRKTTGGKVEIFLLRRLDESDLRWGVLGTGKGLGWERKRRRQRMKGRRGKGEGEDFSGGD